MVYDVAQIDAFPAKPGVYLMKGRRGVVLYVGKAKNLRQRVRQYFIPGRDSRAKVPLLVSQIEAIELIVVASEKEALLLENTLIKEHLPRFNVIFRDDKTYISLRINAKATWPTADLVRYKGKPKADGTYFGPYTSAYAARQTLDLLQRVFPLRQCSDQEFARRTRPCILYDMKRCLAPCVGRCTKEDYDAHVRHAMQFLKGQDREILQQLKDEMERASAALEFERAGRILATIRYIEQTIQTQNVVKVGGGDSDVFALYREAEEGIVSQLIFRQGHLIGSRHFGFSESAQEDNELLESFILQRYDAAEELPEEVIVAAAVEDVEALEEVLTAKRGKRVSVLCPQRGDKVRLVEMAKVNAETSFRRERDAKAVMDKMLADMQQQLRLTHFPSRIECFDNSHLAGSEPVSALVTFTDGVKDSKRYRLFKLKHTAEADDYGAMQEVLRRRYRKAKEENHLPDLLIVDGGKGQLNAALQVLAELDIASIDVIGVAKEQGRHDKGATAEQVFLPGIKDPIRLRSTSPILFLLQRIRDEAHRFALTFHRKRRGKAALRSVLDDVPGIGPKKRQQLLRHFGSLAKLKEAGPNAWRGVPGISEANVQALATFFQSN